MEMTIGKRIATLRKEKGMTQEELSQKMEVSAQAVSKWENDQSCPDITSLPKLAKILGVTVDELLSGKEETAPVARVLAPEERKDIKEMMLRFNVDSCDGDHVRMNIPMALVLVALEMGMDLSQVSGNSALKNIDLEQIVNLVQYGVMGNLMEVESGEGDTVRIFVE
ncbi:MAG: helix-turn-helix transcriptional regulator [Lachnospiraceae bacterium]|nr:helix-turn-helix transcriptional regulator [Lachnospiraceae bacterium]